MMFQEFWASRRALSRSLRSFGRHGALSRDVSGILGVTVRSLMMFEEFWGVTVRSLTMFEVFWAVTVRSLMMFDAFGASRCALS